MDDSSKQLLQDFLDSTDDLEYPTELQTLSDTISTLDKMNLPLPFQSNITTLLTDCMFPSDDVFVHVFQSILDVGLNIQQMNEKISELIHTVNQKKFKVFFTTHGKKHFFFGSDTFHLRESIREHNGTWEDFLVKENQPVKAWLVCEQAKSFIQTCDTFVEFVYDPNVKVRPSKRIEKFS